MIQEFFGCIHIVPDLLFGFNQFAYNQCHSFLSSAAVLLAIKYFEHETVRNRLTKQKNTNNSNNNNKYKNK